MSDEEVVIEEGLTEDSQVISNWSSKLRNGVEAEIVSINGEAAVTDTPAETEGTEAENETADDTETGSEEAADEGEISEDEASDSEEVTEEEE